MKVPVVNSKTFFSSQKSWVIGFQTSTNQRSEKGRIGSIAKPLNLLTSIFYLMSLILPKHVAIFNSYFCCDFKIRMNFSKLLSSTLRFWNAYRHDYSSLLDLFGNGCANWLFQKTLVVASRGRYCSDNYWFLRRWDRK